MVLFTYMYIGLDFLIFYQSFLQRIRILYIQINISRSGGYTPEELCGKGAKLVWSPYGEGKLNLSSSCSRQNFLISAIAAENSALNIVFLCSFCCVSLFYCVLCIIEPLITLMYVCKSTAFRL